MGDPPVGNSKTVYVTGTSQAQFGDEVRVVSVLRCAHSNDLSWFGAGVTIGSREDMVYTSARMSKLAIRRASTSLASRSAPFLHLQYSLPIKI
jgi:hypothetical protein